MITSASVLFYFLRCQNVSCRNCLFRALGDQLEGHSRSHLELRQETVQYMMSHRQDFEPFVEDDIPFTEHCKNMTPSLTLLHLMFSQGFLNLGCSIPSKRGTPWTSPVNRSARTVETNGYSYSHSDRWAVIFIKLKCVFWNVGGSWSTHVGKPTAAQKKLQKLTHRALNCKVNEGRHFVPL